MNPLLSGGTSLTYSPNFELVRDNRGVFSGTQEMWCRKDLFETLIPAVGSVHPDYGFLGLDSLRIRQGDDHPGMVVMDGDYVGAVDLNNGEDNPLDAAPEYSLDLSLAEEPLEQAPYFVDALSAEDIQEVVRLVKNPKLDEDNVPQEADTTGWSTQKTGLYDRLRKGQEAFRDPRVTWTSKEFFKNLPSLNAIGEIDAPSGPVPAVAAGRNWLLAGHRARMKAGGQFWEVERTWDLSGRGGWDSDIYG